MIIIKRRGWSRFGNNSHKPDQPAFSFGLKITGGRRRDSICPTFFSMRCQGCRRLHTVVPHLHHCLQPSLTVLEISRRRRHPLLIAQGHSFPCTPRNINSPDLISHEMIDDPGNQLEVQLPIISHRGYHCGHKTLHSKRLHC